MPNFKEIKEQVLAAQKIADELSKVAELDQSLVIETKKSISKAKESQVLQKLAQLPIENMKDATDKTVRVETLRKFGITSVSAVYLTSQSQLERISGISPESAIELKYIADQMFAAVSESITYGLKVDSLTADDLGLLEKVQDLEAVRSQLRGNQAKLQPIADGIKQSINSTKPLKSRFRWVLAGKAKRNKALNAISEIALYMGDPTTMVLSQLAKQAFDKFEEAQQTEAFKDFKNRASDYYAVLEDVGGSKPKIGALHLDAQLIESIENQPLDTSLLKATLRKYQVFGSKFALTQSRVILGDEMGLGKTMQALAVLTQRQALGGKHFLVVCPASVLVNWQREIQTRSDLTAIKIHGEDQKNYLQLWRNQGGIALTTFDTLKSFDITDEQIAELKLDTLIVDEAHYVKNLGTGRSRTIMRWLSRTPRVLFMTGTPLENRVNEFINLAYLLDQKFASNLNKAALSAGAEAFRREVAPIYLRRNSIEVLAELPELSEINEYCTWEGANYPFYESAVIAGNFMAMRRAAMLPHLSGAIPNKMLRLLELVDEAFENNQKVIIFSYFREVLDYIHHSLGDKAVGPITGSVSSTARQEIVDAFTKSEKPVALVGQIQAAGTGLNIQAASVVILCEPQIKPSLEVQAIARAHRMGQVNNVRVHRLLVPDSVDDQMVTMLAIKTAEFDSYARVSHLADSATTAKNNTDDAIANSIESSIIEMERKRIGAEGDNSNTQS
jgi:SNF2 family DNA or RNA helicase